MGSDALNEHGVGGGGLAAQHVVITGASKGVGAALARELTSRGWRVTSVARSGEMLQKQAQELGTNPVVQDLADPAACEGLLERIENEHGRIDVLVNNAAHPGAGALAEVSARLLREALAVNLGAPMELARQAASLMRPRRSGQIVMVSSVAAGLALRNGSLYTVPKGGLTHLRDSLAQELHGSGINVMLVALGIVKGTELLQLASQDPVMAQTAKHFARLPQMTPAAVAQGIADGVERSRSVLVMPRAYAPIVHLRRAPSLLSDLLTRNSQSWGTVDHHGVPGPGTKV